MSASSVVVVLSGGTGGAKFISGLQAAIGGDLLAVIGNTGDDLEYYGLHVSPDLDSVLYALAGLASRERGWGLQDETFDCVAQLRKFGEPGWFQVGDRDLALHLLRTRLLRDGKTLAEAISIIARVLGISATILPMSNSRVETRVLTDVGDLSFQEYFVRERHEPKVHSVRFEGAETAVAAPGIEEHIMNAAAVFIAPSNPITSIGPILGVRGIRDALRRTPARIAAISPIIAGAAVSGPAGELMRSSGTQVSAAGVAELYRDFLDIIIADEQDQGLEVDPPIRACFTDTIMRNDADRMRLARAAVEAVGLTKLCV